MRGTPSLLSGHQWFYQNGTRFEIMKHSSIKTSDSSSALELSVSRGLKGAEACRMILPGMEREKREREEWGKEVLRGKRRKKGRRRKREGDFSLSLRSWDRSRTEKEGWDRWGELKRLG